MKSFVFYRTGPKKVLKLLQKLIKKKHTGR